MCSPQSSKSDKGKEPSQNLGLKTTRTLPILSSTAPTSSRESTSATENTPTETAREPDDGAHTASSRSERPGLLANKRANSSPSELQPSSRSPSDDDDRASAARAAALDTFADDLALVQSARSTPPDIDPSVGEMGDLSKDVTEANEMHMQEKPPSGPSNKRKKGSIRTNVCQRCSRRDSPQWRHGPDGPGTLCNVCGLLYAQRERRKGSRKGSSSAQTERGSVRSSGA